MAGRGAQDEEGYLDALGKKRTAEVKRDARIGQADADRDAGMRVRAPPPAPLSLSLCARDKRLCGGQGHCGTRARSVCVWVCLLLG
jgi:uncharacterized membrane protein YqiK